MRRIIATMLAACLLASGAAAEGLTLRTVSCFSGSTPAALAYVDILREYEEESGYRVEDQSSNSNEAWKTAVLNDFAAGNEPDILFFFAAGADSAPILSRVVPLEEIRAAYPELELKEEDALREEDGKVYAVPTRGYWEALILRTDIFNACGAPLPTDWASLTEAIRIFREQDIIPISASLSDIPHYVAEMALLATATPEEQQARPKNLDEVPESWERAMEVIRELYDMGAFADNALATNDDAALELFVEGKAAMRMDGSWMADALPEEMMDDLMVIAMPRRDGNGSAEGYVGGLSMGFYLTRKAWNNPERREAAVRLLAALTREDSLRRLEFSTITGRLQDSVWQMEEDREILSPLQDAMNRQARETWLMECVPAVAEGSMTAQECWETVMALLPFEN